jgi:hypothetical protein
MASDLELGKQAVTPKQQLVIEAAHGKVHVFSVGISEYGAGSGFAKLQVCDNDALSVANSFHDVTELNADKSHIKILTSKKQVVSKGAIIKGVHELACGANESDRILFFFSGHGQRLGAEADEFYLVPQDVFLPDDSDTLVSFNRVFELMKQSSAKQKIVIIDACFSGPCDLKKPLTALSPKQLASYLGKTEGIAVLASSSSEQASWAKSPSKNLSLFTWALVTALRGNAEALQDRFLTVNSLFDFVCQAVAKESKSYGTPQLPVRKLLEQGGSIVLGDFNTPLVVRSELDLDSAPLTGIDFTEYDRTRVDDILQSIKSYHYSVEYLERRVNDNLGGHLEDKLGSLACGVADELGFDLSEVNVEGAGIGFPGGTYSIEYEAKNGDKRAGWLVHTVSLDTSWFDTAPLIPTLLRALEMRPKEFKLGLTNVIDPHKLVAGLRARGWQISSKLDSKIEADRGPYKVIVQPDSIAFHGLTPSEILGDNADEHKAQLVAGILMLMS